MYFFIRALINVYNIVIQDEQKYCHLKYFNEILKRTTMYVHSRLTCIG